MLTIPLLFVGFILGVAFLRLVVRLSPHREQSLGFALLVATFIYVAFAMAAMETMWLLVEMAGVCIFTLFVWLGSKRSLLWLAGGWVLHTFWDIGLHTAYDVEFAPFWYPIICVSFDLVVAVYILYMQRSAVTKKQPTIA